jgi:general secretion pathway protein J
MSKRQRGMTLIEVTVAAVIFSMIMLATVTAFRTFAGTYARLEKETARTTQMREAERFLRRTLKSALNGPALFEGKRTALEWVAPIDRVGGVAGLQHLRLTQEGSQLLLSFAPLANLDDSPAWNTATTPFPLITKVDKLRFYYQPSADDKWSDEIISESSGLRFGLPRAVAIEIVADDRPWPPIVVQFDQHKPTS